MLVVGGRDVLEKRRNFRRLCIFVLGLVELYFFLRVSGEVYFVKIWNFEKLKLSFNGECFILFF